MKEGEEQDNPTLFEIMKEDPNITYNEATKIQEDTRLANEAQLAQEKEGVKKYKKGTEIDYHRYWKNMYEEEKKKRQEAQGETTIVKGIGMNSPEMKDAQARIKELDNSLAIALEINESHQRYNGRLQTRVTELEEDNQKLSRQISDHIKNREDIIRKAGM
tara:strand:- start:56 stop:538 length:483 start_codon:yes stop_codon:yes gene_type:complete